MRGRGTAAWAWERQSQLPTERHAHLLGPGGYTFLFCIRSQPTVTAVAWPPGTSVKWLYLIFAKARLNESRLHRLWDANAM